MSEAKKHIQLAVDNLNIIAPKETNRIYGKIKDHCTEALNLMDNKELKEVKNKLALAIRLFMEAPPVNSPKVFNHDTLISMDKAYKQIIIT